MTLTLPVTPTHILPKFCVALCGLFALFVLAGCATLTREQCLEGDWYQIGVNDGQYGNPMSRLDRHRRACEDTPAIINETAYRAGRDVGLLAFCTPQVGYQVGETGRRAPDVCPAETVSGFLQGYRLGEQVHDAEQEVANARQRVRRLDERLDVLQGQIEETRAMIEGSDPEFYDLSGLRRTLQRFQEDANETRADLRDTEFDVFVAERDLGTVRGAPGCSSSCWRAARPPAARASRSEYRHRFRLRHRH